MQDDVEKSDVFFENTPVPMFLLDEDGRVCRSNGAAHAALDGLGADADGLGLGAAVRCVRSMERPDTCRTRPFCTDCSLRRLLAHTLETGKPQRRVEVKVVSRRRGKQHDCYLLLSTAVVELLEGRRIVVCIEDVTKRKSAQMELRTALREVQRLKEQLQQDNERLREQLKQSRGVDECVGKSVELKLTLEKTEHVAATDSNVLILGETGVGKELIARAIHGRSPRRDRPFITVNCTALSGNLIESELFGHVAGAYTGALGDKTGRFELAHGGTIFLDEIAELHPDLQAKLLRVVQHGQFERVGSSKMNTVDVRVVAATNRDLQKAMAEGTFRSDLYYRLAVFPIEVPPLRARREDVPLLAWHFVTSVQGRLGKKIESIPEPVMDMLTEYDWPGNVRELKNVIERAVILSPDSTLRLSEILVNPVNRLPSIALPQEMEAVQRAHITDVLEACRWRINGHGNAAARLGMKPSTLRSRMKKLGIERPRIHPR